jgi:hypothetical protein
MRSLTLSTHALLLALAACASGVAADPSPLPGTNLARGRSATFSLPPNYDYSKGNDDTDLFDGQHAKGGFWTSKETVGWLFGPKPGVLITVDLEAVSPIDAISFNTAAGSAQVTFPGAVFVFVSDDGKSWHYVTDLINEPISQAQYIRHRFVADNLKTRGRHVALYIAKGGFFAFVDEIEVIEGKHAARSVTFPDAAIETERLEESAKGRAKRAAQKNLSLALIQVARNEVMASADGEKQRALQELDRCRQSAVDASEVEAIDYSRGLPFATVEGQVCRVMGSFFASRGREAVTIWQPVGSFWSHTTSPFTRAAEPAAPQLDANMMIGEYEPVAFNISNNTAEPLTLEVEVGDLKAEKGANWAAESVDVRATSHVVASGYLLFDDALPALTDGRLTIAPGMTRQLWLILHSKGVKPGDFRGTVSLRTPNDAFEVPLRATVYPVRMPANPTYTAQSWGYFTWQAARGFEQQAAAEMERAYTNAHVLHHYYIPWPKVDKTTKKLVRPIELDFTRLDEMLAYRPYVKQWLLWPGFEFGYLRLNYYQATDAPQVGTPEHQALFKQWVEQIRDHMKSKGFGTDRWAFYWVDEPGDKKFEELIVPTSRMAKQVDPSILIWEDHQVSLKLLEQYPDAIDIHCCPLSYYLSYPEVLKHVRAEKHPGVHYLAAGSKAGDPHRYYRLHHMASVELGLDGAGLWVWGDDGGQFNDYEGDPSYAMVYATKDGPLTGKRREAWREGIEDVELWRHLRDAAEARGDKQLLKLYRESPAELTRRQGAAHTGTHAELMKTRLAILQALSRKDVKGETN